jgi:hypothetical protein
MGISEELKKEATEHVRGKKRPHLKLLFGSSFPSIKQRITTPKWEMLS